MPLVVSHCDHSGRARMSHRTASSLQPADVHSSEFQPRIRERNIIHATRITFMHVHELIRIYSFRRVWPKN